VSHPPTPPAPVLVVVDRSSSGAAVRYGAGEALRSDRPLRLVHVAPPDDSWLRTVGLDSLRRALAMADAEVVGRVPLSSALLRGGSLHETAREAATAAVVVLEQLRPGAQRRPTESVAAALAAVTDTPVVVVPANWVERHRGVVTVGLDPDAADDTAVRAAMALARLRNSVLTVVVAGTANRAPTEARLERLGGDACDLALEVTSAAPAAALETAAASSDVMVVGRHRPRVPDESRVGSLAAELLARVSCPVLLTAPGHVHSPPAAAGATTPEEEYAMYAQVGDRIVVRSTHLDGPSRDGEVIEVEREDGRPPYRVRWSDNGHESLFFPGPDAYIDRTGPSYEPEYDLPAHAG
jgi:nucleotide-binding universal stress UspA family protein